MQGAMEEQVLLLFQGWDWSMLVQGWNVSQLQVRNFFPTCLLLVTTVC